MCTTAIFHPACSVETGQQISSLPWSQVPVLQLTCWLEAKTQWLLSRNYMMIMIMIMMIMIMIMIMMMILYFAQFSAEESWVEVALLSFFWNSLYMNCFHLSTYLGSPSRDTSWGTRIWIPKIFLTRSTENDLLIEWTEWTQPKCYVYIYIYI